MTWAREFEEWMKQQPDVLVAPNLHDKLTRKLHLEGINAFTEAKTDIRAGQQITAPSNKSLLNISGWSDVEIDEQIPQEGMEEVRRKLIALREVS